MDASLSTSSTPTVTKRALFFGFLEMGLMSFGGVLPWARRILVEQHGWLTHQEFVDALSLGQILPGPNVVNLSIMVGSRFQGGIGALLAFSGLMLAPFAIILLLAVLYTQYGQLTEVQHAFKGIAAATAGLVVAMGLKLISKQTQSWRTNGITLLSFIGSGLLGWPLLIVLGLLAPISIGLCWSKTNE